MKKIIIISLILLQSFMAKAFTVQEKNSPIKVTAKITESGQIIQFLLCKPSNTADKETCTTIGRDKYTLASLEKKLTSENRYFWIDTSIAGVSSAIGGLLGTVILLSSAPIVPGIPVLIGAAAIGGVSTAGLSYWITNIWNSPLEHMERKEILKTIISQSEKNIITVDSIEGFVEVLEDVLKSI